MIENCKNAWKNARRDKRAKKVARRKEENRFKFAVNPWQMEANAEAEGGTFYNHSTFARRLQKKGFVTLGRGFYSHVLHKPGSNKVIKVGKGEDNWIDYAFWAAKNGFAGSYAPKVYSYKQIKGKKSNFIVSVMEHIDHTMSDEEQKNKASDAMVIDRMFGLGVYGNEKAISVMDVVSPGLANFTKKFKEEFGDKRLDVHGGNVMVRSDGTFVLTDPVAGRSTLTQTRLKSKDFSIQ